MSAPPYPVPPTRVTVDGVDSVTGGARWVVINGAAIDPSYILSALRAQVRAEDECDPEGLFRGIDSIRARRAIAAQQ